MSTPTPNLSGPCTGSSLPLLQIGAIPSPSNPLSSTFEISRQIQLTKPSLIFATSSTAPKFSPVPLILLDSPHFLDLLSNPNPKVVEFREIQSSDAAAIMFSSGTTGKVKGVVLTHGNLIAAACMLMGSMAPGGVMMLTVPMFHVFGFMYSLIEVTMGQRLVVRMVNAPNEPTTSRTWLGSFM